MPAKSPEALARKAARKVIRRRERRAELRAIGKPRLPRPPKFNRVLNGRFVGCDGEGVRLANGQDAYTQFRMGDRELYESGRRLTTPELLQFILDHPDPHDYLIGFSFEYDANNILADVQRTRDVKAPNVPSRLERLLGLDIANWQGKAEPYKNSPWTCLDFDGFPTFGVQWVGRNHLKVCRIIKDVTGRYVSDKGSIRTIEDVWGNFQGSFVAALDAWSIGSAQVRKTIAAMKDKRDAFTEIDDETRAYNRLECDLLAQLMEAFRSASIAAGLPLPRSWNGPGKLASALLKANGVPNRKAVETRFPAKLLETARAAFSAGRFETTRAGHVNETVYARDINSAFPSGMIPLPCLHHGRFRKASAATLKRARGLYVAPLTFTHPPDQFLCGLPVRNGHGRMSWPREGAGVYWSPEIRSAKRLGARVELKGGWLYQRKCACKPFAFIERLYAERLKLAATNKAKGIPLKLGMNSGYGKFAQRVGARTWTNPIYAGLITAFTRAKINDAIRTAGQRNVIMIAADSVFSVSKPPDVSIGIKLGQWEAKDYPGLFIVQPGVYWGEGAKAKKTRGVAPKFFEPLADEFEDAWQDYAEKRLMDDLWGRASGALKPPSVPLTIRTFIGLRLAYRLNKPLLACQWLTLAHAISFNWESKRAFEGMSADGLSAILAPLQGDATQWSYTHDDLGRRMAITVAPDGTIEGGELMPSDMKDLFEALPDPIDFSPPFT